MSGFTGPRSWFSSSVPFHSTTGGVPRCAARGARSTTPPSRGSERWNSRRGRSSVRRSPESGERPDRCRPGDVLRHQVVERAEPDGVERRTRRGRLPVRLEGGPADRQWPFAAHEQRSTFPHRGVRKCFHERAHEQLVLRLRPMTDPLQHDPIVIEDAPRAAGSTRPSRAVRRRREWAG